MKTKILVAISVLAFSSAQAFADSSYVGALIGAEVPTTSGGSSAFTYSARLGTDLFSNPTGSFSAGLFLNRASTSSSIGTVTVNGSYTALMAELLGRNLMDSGFYLGARAGLAFRSSDIQSGTKDFSASATSFMVGPAAGYEFPVGPKVDFDLDVTWISIAGTTFTFPTLGDVSIDGASAFLFQGGLTYHW